MCMRPSARVLGPSAPLATLVLSLPPHSDKLPALVNFEDVEVIFKKVKLYIEFNSVPWLVILLKSKTFCVH